MNRIKLAPAVALALSQGSLSAYLLLERYWQDGSISGFHTTVSEPYASYSVRASYPLPVFSVDLEKCVQVGTLPYSWAKSMLDSGRVPIPIHPDVLDKVTAGFESILSNEGMTIEVSPTASGRTVFCQAGPSVPHFIKLHYPAILGRYMRDIQLDRWIASLENSVEFFHLQPDFPDCFGFMHEAHGTYLKGADHQGFGILYREFMPRPHQQKNTLLVPAMSLISKRMLDADTPAMLNQILLDSHSPLEDFVEKFVRPVLISYRFLAFEHGLMPEYHNQNVLYELDLDSGKTRLIYRDMSDIYKDLTLRDELGLNSSFCTFKSTRISSDPDYFKHRSYMFDFRVGQSLLLPMAQSLSEWMKIPLKTIIKAIREEVQSIIAPFADYFYPSNRWYKYASHFGPDQHTFIELDNPPLR